MSLWTVRKELTTLKSALHFGHRKGLFGELPEIDLGPKPPSRTRWLKPGQAQTLLDAAYQTMHLWLFIVLALSTGARKGAILALTWERVDFDTGRIDFKEPGRPETHKRRTVVPMTARARVALLEAREMARSDYVIEWNGKRVADIKTGLRSAVRRAGLENVSAHTLKHTCVSWLAQGGVSMEKAGELTATDPVTLREIYRHFDPEHLSDLGYPVITHTHYM